MKQYLKDLEHVKHSIVTDMNKQFRQTGTNTEPKISIYSDVDFFEYCPRNEKYTTIGFSSKIGQINILLYCSSIEKIRQNRVDVVSHMIGPRKLISPIVFTIDYEKEKDPFRIHSDKRGYIDGNLLWGDFLYAYLVIVTECQKLHFLLEHKE